MNQVNTTRAAPAITSTSAPTKIQLAVSWEGPKGTPPPGGGSLTLRAASRSGGTRSSSTMPKGVGATGGCAVRGSWLTTACEGVGSNSTQPNSEKYTSGQVCAEDSLTMYASVAWS